MVAFELKGCFQPDDSVVAVEDFLVVVAAEEVMSIGTKMRVMQWHFCVRFCTGWRSCYSEPNKLFIFMWCPSHLIHKAISNVV